jgi:hypothetical protein
MSTRVFTSLLYTSHQINSGTSSTTALTKLPFRCADPAGIVSLGSRMHVVSMTGRAHVNQPRRTPKHLCNHGFEVYPSHQGLLSTDHTAAAIVSPMIPCPRRLEVGFFTCMWQGQRYTYKLLCLSSCSVAACSLQLDNCDMYLICSQEGVTCCAKTTM